MPSLKGLALGVGAVIVVGYIALKTGAAKGLSDMAKAVTGAVAAPFAGLGEGLGVLGTGISTALSPTIAPTIAPTFDWSGWLPFGNGNGNGKQPTTYNGNGRQEDRSNGNGPLKTVGLAIETNWTVPPFIADRRPEDRTNGRYIAL